MSNPPTYERLTWIDRFNVPTIEKLRQDLPPHAQETFDDFHGQFQEITGIEAQPMWYGHSWYWAIGYSWGPSGTPLAVIVPNPEDLQLAIQFDRDLIESMPMERMKRAVRDGLDLAREPFHTQWAVWSIAGTKLVDDLLQVIELKRQHLASKAG